MYSRETNNIWTACGWRFHDWVRRTYHKYTLDELHRYVGEYLEYRSTSVEEPWLLHMEAIAISKVLRCPVSALNCKLPSWNAEDPASDVTLDEYLRDCIKLGYVIAENEIVPGTWIVRINYDLMLHDPYSEGNLCPVVFEKKEDCEKYVEDIFAEKGRSIVATTEKNWGCFYAYEDNPEEVAALVTVVRRCDVERFSKNYIAQVERQAIINSFLHSKKGQHYKFPDLDTQKDMIARIFNGVFASLSLPWIVSPDLQLESACIDLPF